MLGVVNADAAAGAGQLKSISELITIPGQLAIMYVPGLFNVIDAATTPICGAAPTTTEVGTDKAAARYECAGKVQMGGAWIVTAGLAFLAYTMFFKGKG